MLRRSPFRVAGHLPSPSRHQNRSEPERSYRDRVSPRRAPCR
ncbi:hypothetical protein F750_1279 [Streptomyces sp. PAMC 26508]|nr:hypothetical protein F750_1279 [Streptomyces sp. PAMC 26508]